MKNAKFMAGAAREDNTPVIGTLLFGYNPFNESTSVHDPLQATAVKDELTDGENLEITQNCNKYGYAVEILSAQVLGNDKKLMRFSLSKPYPKINPDGKPAFPAETFEYFQVFVKKYQGGIQTLKVYGAHYRAKEGLHEGKEKYLVMTDVEDEYSTSFNYNDNKIKLIEPPTQINGVYVGKGGGAIQLTPSTNKNNLLWTTTSVNVGNTSVLKITGGQYYYDAYTGYIHLPYKDQNNLTPS